MTRILQLLEMQIWKAEMEILLECYKHIPPPKPHRQIPAVPNINENVPTPRRKYPVFQRFKEHRVFKRRKQ